MAAQLGLCGIDQPRRGNPQQACAIAELGFEIVDIGLPDGRFGAEKSDNAGFW